MKFFKWAAAMALAAVVSVGTAAAAYAESPMGAGTPTGAELLITDENASQSVSDSTSGQAPTAQIPESSTKTEIGSSDKTYEPIDTGSWTEWDGTSELLENTDYYIDGKVGIRGEPTLPASSRLLLTEGSLVFIYTETNLSVYGSVIIAPGAELIHIGTLSIMKGGTFENYGTTKLSLNSTTNISSAFVTYGEAQTAAGGLTLVYSGGKVINYGAFSVPKYAETTVTGEWLSAENGMMYIDGTFTTTLSGKLKLLGYASVQEHGRIVNSGTITFDNTIKYYVDEKAKVTNTQSGRIIDCRDPAYSIPTEEFQEGIKGIDVSSWQGIIDWKRVKEAGIKFAIIRSSSGPRVDTLFDYNITQAQKQGIFVGVYHYCYAMNPEEAREEARHFIETIKYYRIDYPVMFDFEDNSQAKLGKEKLTEIAEAFLTELKNAGYYPMIYSYRYWLENNLDMDRLSDYDVALAEWNVAEPKYTLPYGIWQYSCKGKISGISGDVDLDLCYKNYAKIIIEGGFNNLKE